MLFDDKFISGIDDNPIGSVVSACDRTITDIEQTNAGWDPRQLKDLMETAVLVNEIIQNHELATENYVPEMSNSLANNCEVLIRYLTNIRSEFQGHAYEIQFGSISERYKAALKSTFAYEFSKGDLERIQALINELRTQIAEIDGLEGMHRQRLLSRLEKLQSELHKRVSDLDKFWGMIGDAGVVLGKLGTDAKPIVDRIRELAGIAWRTQSRAEELPSGTKPPLIESTSEE
ncbi:hypothetical protein [Pseudidiomarina gelatinasegens]|uniref:hypothetical protein n=1 Tax=Pseudidiomarina gelatinasegens TaxID=2487740 RepID=UPI003A980612